MPKPNPVPDRLTLDQWNAMGRFLVKTWPHHLTSRSSRITFAQGEIDAALDWARMNHGRQASGRPILDYPAFIRNWMRKTMERKGYEPYRPPSSRVNPRGKQAFERPSGPMQAALFDTLHPGRKRDARTDPN